MSGGTKTSVSCEWSSRPRDYPLELHSLQCFSEEVLDHPLKPLIVTMSEGRVSRLAGRGVGAVGGSTTSSTGSSTPTPTTTLSLPSLDPLGASFEGSDPLSHFAAAQDLDPLSKMAADAWDGGSAAKKPVDSASDDLEPWAARKSGILSKFTTSEKLSIVTSFLPGGEKVVVKAQSQSVVDKVKHRLEQLDDFDEGSVRQMLDLSQQEYMGRIEQLNQELVQAWHHDQRVKALKIAIQCSKLLVDTSVIQFYPSKFVLITDILDIFGKLVYDRLRTKAEYYVPGSKTPTALPENFTPDIVPESAKETCRNWFYKIASIRELVPRLYVEMAILNSYSFLTSTEFSQALLRLTRMIRGIGDPLVAVYARCYLCRVGMAVNTTDRQYIKENFYDFLATYHQLFTPTITAELNRLKVDLSTYLTLYTPALDWILHGVATNAPESLLVEILSRCREKRHSALLLNSIMAAFKPSYIASRALEFIDLLAACDEEGFPQYLLFRTLGLCLTLADPPSEVRLQVLNDVWRIVTKLEDPGHYMSCAEVWIQFAVKHFSCREVNTFLSDIIRHMTPDRAYEQYYPQLQTVINKIITHTSDFESLLTMDKFLPLIDMFQKESIKVSVCKSVMDFYTANHQETTNDPVIINALMFICRILHDSVNALTVDDEKRQIGNLISAFVRNVQYGRDFEQQLSFYVEARAAFANLDMVHAHLVQSVNRLSVETRCIVKGHHTRKTAAFVRACAAFCYITIPSISSTFARLELYLLSGQVALLNQCLGQGDACFKAAITELPALPATIEVDGAPRSVEPYLVAYIQQFLSTLLIVPDNPEQGVLYLTRALMNAVQQYPWQGLGANRARVYLSVLDMLSSASQEHFLYHVEKVDSNDTLYGSDPKFITEINKMCSILIEEILGHLKVVGSNEQYKLQANLALAFFSCIVIRGHLQEPSMMQLAVSLWHLAHRHGSLDSKQAVKTVEYLRKRGLQGERNVFAELLSKIQVRKD